MTKARVVRGPDGLPKWKNAREVARIVHRGNGLRLVMLGCGKENCSKCNGRHKKSRGLFVEENEERVRYGKTADWNMDRKPLHGPYWYLLRYSGRHARQWAIGRVLFGAKLRLHSDKEIIVVNVLRGAKVKLGPREFWWEPEGWTDEDRETIGGMDSDSRDGC